MKPVIGITCDYNWDNGNVSLYKGYYEAVWTAGGLPFLLPYIPSGDVPLIISKLDGLLLSGGQDIDPCIFGERPYLGLGRINPVRDEIEIKLCRFAIDRRLPVLGLCRGIQVMNIAMGGTVYQDLERQWGGEKLINHFQKAPGWYGIHEIKIDKNSLLHNILCEESVRVNSFHHQAVKEIAPGFKISATCADGVVEAIESEGCHFAVGVQWHPERMWEHDSKMLALFKALVCAAKEYSKMELGRK